MTYGAITTILYTISDVGIDSFHLYVGKTDNGMCAVWQQGFFDSATWGTTPHDAVGEYFIQRYGTEINKPINTRNER